MGLSYIRLRVLLWLAVAAAPLSARQLPIQVFSIKNGLPRNRVNCLTATTDGFLWICTADGLVRFDGYRFRTFGTEQGLPSRVIYNFAPSRKGGFWVNTDLGVCLISADSKTGEPCRLLESGKPPDDFGAGAGILEASTGETWFATARSLLRLSADGRLKRLRAPVPPQESVYCIGEGAGGALLIGTDLALYEWKDGSPLRHLSGSVGPTAFEDIGKLASGETWLATNRGVYRMAWDASGGTFRLAPFPFPGLAAADQIIRRRDGTLWVAGDGIGQIVFDPRGKPAPAYRITAKDGLPDSRIILLAEDAEGNLWGATESAGIFRIDDSGFTRYGDRDGLGPARIISIFEALDRRLCVRAVLSPQVSLTVGNPDGFAPVALRRPDGVKAPGWGWNQFGFQAHDGEWWFPTGFGLLRYPKLDRIEDLARTNPVAVYGADSPLESNEIFRVFEDNSGNVWISTLVDTTTSRLITWDRKTGRFHHWTGAEGWQGGETASAIRQESGGAVWIGTNSGVVRFRGGRFQSMSLEAGTRSPLVRDLHIDRAGRIWVATRNGLYRCDNADAPEPVFRGYTVRQGLSADAVRSVITDDAGFVYAGTVAGVDRIDPAAPIESRRIRHLTWAQGLPESEQNTAFRDSRGHLWFGTLNGLAEFDPSKSRALSAPKVYFNRVRVRGEEVQLPWEGTGHWSLDLAADRNQVEIEYAAIDLQGMYPLSYQYRMAGIDDKWSAPTDRSSVNYARLPAGNLHLEVRALNADGLFGPIAGLDLTVHAPVWRRWWFLSAIAAILAGATILAYQYRVNRLLAFEKLRTRIATDLHDDIGASLSQISILSEVAKKGAGPQVLSDIAEISRGIVQEMSDIVWAVNPRHDRFDALAHRMRRFAEDTFAAADIELDFETEHVSGESFAPLELRRPLYLVFKEAVNNVVRHSRASRAVIRLEIDGPSLTLSVQDDGRGFDVAEARDGEGLLSIGRRAHEVGGEASWRSAPGEGTLFTATLPLRGPRARGRRRSLFRRA